MKRHREKDMEEMHITKWKKQIWKGYILYDLTLWPGKNNTMETVKRWGVGGRDGWIGRAQRIFKAL